MSIQKRSILTKLYYSGKHVVFGRVIRGFEDVVMKIVGTTTDEKDRPLVPIVISNCGELELKKPPQKPVPDRQYPFHSLYYVLSLTLLFFHRTIDK